MKCPTCGYDSDAQYCPLCGSAMNARNAGDAFALPASFWDSAATPETQYSGVSDGSSPASAPETVTPPVPQETAAPESEPAAPVDEATPVSEQQENSVPEAAPDLPPQNGDALEIPIPASFFADDSEKPQTVFSLPSETAGKDTFTIRTDSLEFEAVGKTEPPPQSAQKPASASRTAARKSAPPPMPPQPERGFYAVPEYDGSLRAALSRIRHKWLVPALVAGIFVFGMTAGILLARSGKPEIAPDADASAENLSRSVAGESSEDFTELMNEALMLSYVQDRLLPKYGYAAVGEAVSYDKTDGILSVIYGPEQMTVFRCEKGALCVENYVPKNARMNRAETTTYPAFLSDVCSEASALPITADKNGVSLGGKQIWQQDIGIASGEVTVCTCEKQGDAASAENAEFLFCDETGIRDEIRANTAETQSPADSTTVDWHALYAMKLRAEMTTAKDAEFGLLYIDDNDTPELVIRSADTPCRLFTIRNNAVTALLTGSSAETVGCVPFANRYYETGSADDGGITDYFYWCHIENGAAVRDYRRWVSDGSAVPEFEMSDSFETYGTDPENTDGTEETVFYALKEDVIRNLLE